MLSRRVSACCDAKTDPAESKPVMRLKQDNPVSAKLGAYKLKTIEFEPPESKLFHRYPWLRSSASASQSTKTNMQNPRMQIFSLIKSANIFID